MIDFQEIITDSNVLSSRYIVRNGIPFTAITHPANIYDAVVIRHPHNVECSFSKTNGSRRSLKEQIDFINEHKIKKALVISDNIDFITECPGLNFLRIVPADNSGDGFDYTPLYKMPQIKSLQCSTIYGDKNAFSTVIDCAKIKGLEDIHISNAGYKNYTTLRSLKSLGLTHYENDDLSQAFCSSVLDTLSIFQSKIRTLNGIQKSQKMQCLYLYNNRSLQNISALKEVKNSLRALRIENCPKIDNFSVLAELESLELLELSGSNELPDLCFLSKMKNLKTFIFSMNVVNGDLTPCLNLSYAYSEKNRKHYNLKDIQLPKFKFVRGNETIEDWRRLE